MAKIVVIVGHERTGTYCEALGESYACGARAAGHEASVFVTSRMAFDPVLREGFSHIQPLEPDLQAAHDAITAADHLVFIFPLWLGTMPALFKSFLERVLQPDLVQSQGNGHFPKLLKGKSARIVITMAMPSAIYRCWFGAHALKVLRRNILRFLGAKPIHSLLFGNVEGVGLEGRQKWLKEMEDLGRAAA